MLNKIYLIAFAVLLAAMAVLTYLANSWLASIGDPNIAREEYFFYTSWGLRVLLGGFLVLLIVANTILWSTRKAWALWLSFLYFALFAFLRYWWLDSEYLDFALRRGLTNNNFSLGPILAVLLVAVIGAIVFFDQFIVLRLSRKMHPEPVEGETGGEPGEAEIKPPAEE